jgi:hypothetical protein
MDPVCLTRYLGLPVAQSGISASGVACPSAFLRQRKRAIRSIDHFG